MRVLSVINELGMGGAETHLARIAPALKTIGVDIDIYPINRHGALVEPIEAAGISVYGPRESFDHKEGLVKSLAGYVRAVTELRQFIRRGRYDIVHSYLFLSDAIAVPAATLAGCHRIIISRLALHRWLHPPNALFHGLEQTTNLLADDLIANSKAVLHDIEAQEPFLPRSRTVIYHGVDSGRYQPAHPGLNRHLRVVTVGALAPRKGQEFAVEAIALLAQRGILVSLELVGNGPDEEMLRRRARDEHVEDLVIFRGEQPDPRSILSSADLFLLPSRQEGFSGALLEAMASGLPCVVTDVGGNSEAIIHGCGGFVIQSEQPRAIAEAIAELDGNRQLLADMGQSNRDRVRETFSLETSARQLADWYFRGPRSRN